MKLYIHRTAACPITRSELCPGAHGAHGARGARGAHMGLGGLVGLGGLEGLIGLAGLAVIHDNRPSNILSISDLDVNYCIFF